MKISPEQREAKAALMFDNPSDEIRSELVDDIIRDDEFVAVQRMKEVDNYSESEMTAQDSNLTDKLEYFIGYTAFKEYYRDQLEAVIEQHIRDWEND